MEIKNEQLVQVVTQPKETISEQDSESVQINPAGIYLIGGGGS